MKADVDLPVAALRGGRVSRAEWWGRVAFLIIAVLVIAGPYIGLSPSMSRQLVFLAVALMVVTGLNISLGYAGEMALGQSVLVAAGAYAAGIIAIANPWLPLPVHLIIGGLAGAALGLLIGVPGLRLGSWSLAIVTFLTVLILPDVLTVFSGYTGGLLGLPGIPLPVLVTAPLSVNAYYSIVMVVLVVWFILYRNLILSRWAVILLTMRSNTHASVSLGYSIYRLKLLVYVVSSIPAAIGGTLLAFHTSFVGPELFTLERSIGYLASLILGGAGSVYGAIVGAVVVEMGPFHTGIFEQYALLAFGALLIIGAVLVPGGIAAALRRLTRARPLAFRRFDIRSSALTAAGNSRSAAQAFLGREKDDHATLAVDGITVGFGGAIVLDGVSFAVGNGVTGLIGPNGSGKTTLLNAVSGFVPLRKGSISIGGETISGLSAWRRARHGLARTFQTPRLPKDVLVVEAVAAAATPGISKVVATMLRLPRWRETEREELGRALAVLDLVGLSGVHDRLVSEVPAGQLRLIDIARSLMQQPRVLLLDEPAAGLTDTEIDDLRFVLKELASSGITVVLIDHNLSFVSSTCGRAIVLDAGNVIYDGEATKMVDDPAVREAYIGAV
jgi:branched-chain amino acid transport system permease protein